MKRILLAVVGLATVVSAPALQAQTGNIDPSQRHAWAENAGWLDFRPVFGGVSVLPTYLTGYAWSEAAGWVKLGTDAGGPYVNDGSPGTWGVNLNSVTGVLSGFAWSESAGWIRMDPAFGGVTYDGLTHQMSGWAWSESHGWIHFRSTTLTGYGVAVTCGSLTGTVTGGGTVCAGDSSTVTVTVSGGTAPYTMTLDNSGGTQSGAGPAFTFTVSPASTTTYSVASFADALSCVGAFSGSATVTMNPRPATPVLTAPPDVWPEQSFSVSVPAVAGVTYAWTVTNGTMTAGVGTREITITAGTTGSVVVSVTETDQVSGCVSQEAGVSMPIGFLATGYHVFAPCRLFDTRFSSGDAAAAPALSPGETRTLAIGTRCGIPTSTVRSLAVKQTVTAPSADGEIVLFRGDLSATPITSSLSYRAGMTRANNGILELSSSGDGTIKVHNRSTGSVNFILDVTGAFQ
jgi:hypothetical protein